MQLVRKIKVNFSLKIINSVIIFDRYRNNKEWTKFLKILQPHLLLKPIRS
ncbi:hypothetical protein MARI151_60283 [Maribacter litoralis]|uniref:Uncharacterized protein n=1 Tax=Maribacter litoralis TaxID=2059726 RepID=A0A653WJN8_9FLAO|nr:hypothetical protein MARI151_60283 [Maribacter litoralis]